MEVVRTVWQVLETWNLCVYHLSGHFLRMFRFHSLKWRDESICLRSSWITWTKARTTFTTPSVSSSESRHLRRFCKSCVTEGAERCVYGRLRRWFCCARAQGIRCAEVEIPNEGGRDVGEENEKNKLDVRRAEFEPFRANFMKEVLGDTVGKVIVTD